MNTCISYFSAVCMNWLTREGFQWRAPQSCWQTFFTLIVEWVCLLGQWLQDGTRRYIYIIISWWLCDVWPAQCRSKTCCMFYICRALVCIMSTAKEDAWREQNSPLGLVHHMLMVYWIAGEHPTSPSTRGSGPRFFFKVAAQFDFKKIYPFFSFIILV